MHHKENLLMSELNPHDDTPIFYLHSGSYVDLTEQIQTTQYYRKAHLYSKHYKH